MSDSDPIVCKPTKWFLMRAIAMLLMFFVMAAWFVKDGKVGYPKKNVIYYTYQAFEKAEEEFEAREGVTKEAWESFVATQKIPFPEEKGILPAGVENDQPWPAILGDFEAYRKAHEIEGSQVVPTLWSKYSDDQGWDEKPPKKDYDAKSIREQMIFAVICGTLGLFALVVLLRTLSREMKVDGEAFYAPGKVKIPFKSMRRIDKRKWDTKGLATVTFVTESDVEKKAKIDGMVYGQFNPENGAPAQALFDRIMANFSGELVDLESDDAEEEEGGQPEVSEG